MRTVSPLIRRLAINLYFLEQPAPRRSIRSAWPSSSRRCHRGFVSPSILTLLTRPGVV